MKGELAWWAYLRCMLGLHYWSEWSTPKPGETLGGGMVLVQARYCKNCNRIEHNRIDL